MRSTICKWIASLLAVIMVLTMLPCTAFAEGVDAGSIEKITGSAEVSGDSISVSGATLEWYPADMSIGRYRDGWWVGFRIVAPEGITDNNVNVVKYSNDGTDNLVKSFGANNDGKTADGRYYMGCWLPVTQENLETALANGANLSWTYKFDWDGDGTADQTFTATVDPSDITLMKDGSVWCKTVNGVMIVKDGEEASGSIEKITESAEVSVDSISVSGATLEWYPADMSIGRYRDGWWVGFRIVAPESITDSNVNVVKYSNDGTDNLVKSFGTNNDGKTADGRYYMGCWLPVTQEYLETALSKGANLSWTYKFDWDGDGTADQTFTAIVDPSDITLMKDGSVWCKTVNGVMIVKDGEEASGSIEKITESAEVSGDSISVSGATLEWYPADMSIGRYKDGWWVGFRIVAPESITDSNVNGVKYSNDGTDNLVKSFGANNDGKTADGRYYMGCWLPVTQEYLETALSKGANLSWTYKFDWDGDGTADQTFTAVVDPSDITLMKDGSVWCKTVNGVMIVKDGEEARGSIEKITEAAEVSGDSISVSGATLEWYPADMSVGRYKDGWWVGFRIVAPESITDSNVNGVKYSNDGTDDLVKSFGANNDGKTADGRYYMGCWLPVTQEYLETALSKGANLSWTYKFDWDGDGTADQTFTAIVDPSDITLMKDGGVWCKTVDGVMIVKDGQEVHYHEFGSDWKYGDSTHWHECACGEKADEEYHTFGDWTDNGDGTHTRTCTVCDKTETEDHTYSDWKDDGTGVLTRSCTDCESTETAYLLTVKYVYSDGSTAAESYTRICLSGYEYSVTTPSLKWSTPDVASVEGEIGTSPVTVTVTFAPNTTGWQSEGEYILHYDAITGIPYIGEHEINGKNYTFDSEGHLTGPVDISDCTFEYEDTAVYYGKEITPEVKVTFNGITLTEGKHYTLTYTDNSACGYAKITVTGLELFDGSEKTLDLTIYPQYGDVNMNGSLDAGDYLMTKRAFLGTYTLNEMQLRAADVNRNGKLDASDYLMIKRAFLGTYVIPQD